MRAEYTGSHVYVTGQEEFKMTIEGQNMDQAAPGDLVNEPTDEQKRAVLEKRLHAAAFAEIVSVMMRSPAHKEMPLKNLEGHVVPPFLTKQFSIARAKSKEGHFPIFPVGVALWASVSDEVDQRLSENPDGPIQLKPNEWKSGDNLWIIDIVARPEVGVKILGDLKKTAFKGKQFKMRVSDASGTRKIETISGDAA